ncbi:hypothetical protein [Euzebya rosea]|uniref:hypothetical protein n=1 Tax=Euzebya rosea TaxID=2052804 RepID=UPI000D3EDC78|nr:hypothetical protein [Euzebya rosea]
MPPTDDDLDTAPGSADLSALRDALGQPPPGSLATLDQAVVDDLAGLVVDARRGQESDLVQAIDDALRLVPRPLRGVVKRVILP